MPKRYPQIVIGPGGLVHIQTPNLLLRSAQKAHSPALHQAFADAEVMKYWVTAPHTSIAQTTDWVINMENSPQNGKTDFIISYHAIAIGKVGVSSPTISPPGGEIRFLLAKEFQRRGFMKEALSALLPYLVNEKGYECITAVVDSKNDVSVGLLLRFGFRIVGRREKSFWTQGKWHDSLDLELRARPGTAVATMASPSSSQGERSGSEGVTSAHSSVGKSYFDSR